MIKLKYMLPQKEALPDNAEYREGITVNDLIEDLRDELKPLIEISFSELTFISNHRTISKETKLYDGQELLILKPTSGG